MLSSSLSASTYDNQWFPFGSQILFRKDNRYSAAQPAFWVTVGERSRTSQWGNMGTYEVFGAYDLNVVAQALELVGKPNPLRSEWQGQSIPYRQRGTLQMVSAFYEHRQMASEWAMVGGSIFFAALKTRPELLLLKDQASPVIRDLTGQGDIAELDRDTRIAACELGLTNFAAHELGWGDLDLYVRAGHQWKFPYKFRSIDAGVWFGMLAPTGVRRHINEPYSLPYAGNGFWGIYGAWDMEFEFKEDMKVGFLLRGQKRFSRTFLNRVPALSEPVNYGAIVGDFQVDPGSSIIFVAAAELDDVREGLGFYLAYQLVKKFNDTYRDRRPVQTPAANLVGLNNISGWMDEHITVKMFYDFSKATEPKHHAPLLYLRWDFPIHGLGARRVAETNRIVFGLDIPY